MKLQLTERNASIVAAHADGRSLKSIAEELGLSYQRVCQIVARANRREQRREHMNAIRASFSNNILQTPIEAMDLPARLYVSLRHAGLLRIGDITALSVTELRKIRLLRVRPVVLRHICHVLATEFGIELKP